MWDVPTGVVRGPPVQRLHHEFLHDPPGKKDSYSVSFFRAVLGIVDSKSGVRGTFAVFRREDSGDFCGREECTVVIVSLRLMTVLCIAPKKLHLPVFNVWNQDSKNGAVAFWNFLSIVRSFLLSNKRKAGVNIALEHKSGVRKIVIALWWRALSHRKDLLLY